jgi:hypothetical protein
MVGPRLKNDVIALFTDGEEAGLLGAKAFVEQHPSAMDIGLVLNFEARGNRGPVLMFETSSVDRWLIDEFAAAAPYPFSSSMFDEVYQRLPNDTDFTIFKDLQLSGFNFSNIDGHAAYHASLDSIANIDERTLQHHGLYMLPLVRHFGNLSLEQRQAEMLVYFDLLGLTLIRYSYATAIVLIIVASLLFGAVACLCIRAGEATPTGVLWGCLIFLLQLCFASLGILAAQSLLTAIYPELVLPNGDAYNSYLLLMSFTSIVAAVTATNQALWQRRARAADLTLGALAWWLVAAIGAIAGAPGTSYLFVWPLVFILTGVAVFIGAKRANLPASLRVGLLLLCSVLPIVLFVPIISLLFVALTLRLSLIPALAAAFFWGLLFPYLSLPIQPRYRIIAGSALLAGSSFLIAGILAGGFDAQHPKPNNILYGFNADTGEAVWATADQATDEWTAQFLTGELRKTRLPAYFPFTPKQFLSVLTEPVALPAPALTILEDTSAGGARRLRMRVTSSRQAPLIWVYVTPSSKILGGMINGRPIRRPAEVSSAEDRWGMLYWGSPPTGFELLLETRDDQPLTIELIDRVEGLPAIRGTSFKPRSEAMMPTPALGIARFSNASLVSRSFHVPATRKSDAGTAGMPQQSTD